MIQTYFDPIFSEKILGVIQDAQIILLENPNPLHGIAHHTRVESLCWQIIYGEMLGEEICVPAVIMAAWWHDIGSRDGTETTLLEKSLAKHEIEGVIAQKALQCVREHTWDAKQEIPESKIVSDADKLDLLSPSRITQVGLLLKAKKISSQQTDEFVGEWDRRLPLIYNRLHFPTSENLYWLIVTPALQTRKLIEEYF